MTNHKIPWLWAQEEDGVTTSIMEAERSVESEFSEMDKPWGGLRWLVAEKLEGTGAFGVF